MKDKKSMKRVLEAVFLFVFLFTMALLAECVIFQFRTLVHKEDPIHIDMTSDKIKVSKEEKLAKLTEDEQENIRINQENEKLLAQHYGYEYTPEYDEGIVEKDGELYREVVETKISFRLENPYYIQKFDLRIPLEQKGGYTLRIVNEEKEKTIYCSIDPKIDAGITNVNAFGQDFEITFLSEEEIQTEQMTIKMSNTFRLNWLRIFIVFVFLFCTFFAFLLKDTLVKKPELVFAVSALLIGGALIWGVGTNQVGYDEYTHAKSAYDLSFGSKIETTESAMQLKGNLLPFFYTPQERELIEEYEQKNHDFSWADITYQSRMVRAENRVYYPNAIGFAFARLIHADFAASVMLAKFFGLLSYVAVMYLAIALAQRYKMLVAFIALLPNNLFMACSITRDMVVTSFLILGTVLMMNEFLEYERKLTWQNTLGILLAFVIGSVSKPIYIVMPLLMLFLPKNKFENRVQESIFKIALCIVAGLMIYDIFCPTPVATSNHQLVTNLAFAGDKRSSGTSVSGQIQYIISSPVSYVVLLIKSMISMVIESLTVDSFINYGYLGKAPMLFNWLALAVGFWLSIMAAKNEERRLLSKPYIVWTMLMLLGTAAVVWTSMYVSYTAVGSSTIEGVQGRYFIPLFVPFFVCLFTKNKMSRLERSTMNRIAFLLGIYMNLFMVYFLVLKTMNV